ncbi:cell division protein SepF [Allostreptomyces psammosilenae]|uniref:Cell division protein SepF n=1 Tax=Allostreptomyces psammosilenae TaxID=1892865 RepID=A0A852ZXN8_9ACTN|nr:cell division protein SepF [Allostreptomyces psammosilenae]NYI07106.1 cell division inhibitor SepF [Allostreptomyces psammosilenae]
MAGAMRKMAVYLGLMEDPEEYDYGSDRDLDDEFDVDRTDRHERTERPRELRDGHDDDADGVASVVTEVPRRETARREDAPPPRIPSVREVRDEEYRDRGGTVSPITPVRRVEKNAPVIMPKAVPDRESYPRDSYRITTLHPRTYNEARTIGEHFREGTPVIMNLTEMDDTDAKRLVDFAAGLIFGLRGSIERVTQKVFLLSPANVDVTAEDKARIAEGGFFNQS